MATTTFSWRLTDAGRALLVDGANRAARAVQLIAIVVGDQHGAGGADDDNRIALRRQKGRGALTGSSAIAGRWIVEATITATAAYSVTEVGLIGRVGDAGDEKLVAYWTGGGTAIAASGAAGNIITIAGAIQLQAAAADVAVTVAPAISYSAPAVEIAGAVTLTAGEANTRALSRPLADYRWIEVVYGPAAARRSTRLPVADIPALTLTSVTPTYYVVNGGRLKTLTLATGALSAGTVVTIAPASGDGLLSLAALDGVLYSTRGSSIYTIDPQTAAGSTWPALPEEDYEALTAHLGSLYALRTESGMLRIVRVDVASATVTRFGTLPRPAALTGIGLTSRQGHLYYAALRSSGIGDSKTPTLDRIDDVGTPTRAARQTRIASIAGSFGGPNDGAAVVSVPDGFRVLLTTVSHSFLNYYKITAAGVVTQISNNIRASGAIGVAATPTQTLSGTPAGVHVGPLSWIDVWRPTGQASQLALRARGLPSVDVRQVIGIP